MIATEPVPKDATNEPEKKRLDWDELDVIEKTSAVVPVSPPKGAADQDDEAVSQTATDAPGEVNWPPAHTCLFALSQKSARTTPLGALEPRAEIDPDEYDATLAADVLPTVEKLPAK